jgi:hypothetical protein
MGEHAGGDYQPTIQPKGGRGEDRREVWEGGELARVSFLFFSLAAGSKPQATGHHSWKLGCQVGHIVVLIRL